MKALKIIGIIIVIIFAIILSLVLFLPPHSHIERSIVINAKPSQVFNQLNSFKNFNTWSPWAALDPNTKYEFSGPETGVGAFMSWSSENKNVGSGTQKIVESEPDSHLKNEMTFSDFDGKAYAEFILVSEGDATKVTWTYDGDMSGMYKIMGLMMDKILGPSYEQGLSKLKEVVESKPAETTPVDTPADSTAVK
ncbi:MAG TPA: SRPBCC family protein [Cyclobacteriaceae bacterium]|nr:SRPBCC family protein [Cyclobacteriaceae bacterium]